MSRPVRVVPIPGGPVLVRGASEVLDEEGRAHPVERPVVALCVCDLSQRKPWCDGTHKVAADNRRSGLDT
ncbi:MAG TPA: CDGSH iron-sulfur domain-containing protein [Nocardioides sp.]|nr:CDGSH iron-sulfur domain-containing protein [Nocardioides sp.]